jgi:hypothetical protein
MEKDSESTCDGGHDGSTSTVKAELFAQYTSIMES